MFCSGLSFLLLFSPIYSQVTCFIIHIVQVCTEGLDVVGSCGRLRTFFLAVSLFFLIIDRFGSASHHKESCESALSAPLLLEGI